ncbi:hypothetical protein O181_026401 [Austropuccinia psidii MF-1]|uniref:Uncharacterized protein n=1 Tax=Austropuccinia psidii MF-1 TaxID=1389203 RepID=A0A9Q3H0G6_9BASI|nr:hypothetical protein [Austropuccinia psidii MF-1]
MPFQHSPCTRRTRFQDRAQPVLNPTPRAPLDGTTALPQLRAHLDRGPNMTTFKGPYDHGEEEESDDTEVVPATVRECRGTEGPTTAQSNQTVSHKAEPSLLAIIQQMTQIMANIQEASSSEASRQLAFKPPSIKAPDFFFGTKPFKVRSFIQSCQLILHND